MTSHSPGDQPGAHSQPGEPPVGHGAREAGVDPHPGAAAASGACTTERGDARALSAADGSYDAVLLLGPLYPLPERAVGDDVGDVVAGEGVFDGVGAAVADHEPGGAQYPRML
jgi:hypothetical protein